MRIIDRLDMYMNVKQINDNQITTNCGLSVGLIGKARQGKSDLGKKSIDKILNYYQDINHVWLLTGEGSMLKESKVREATEPKVIGANTEHYNLVPVYNFDAVGSMGGVNDITDSPAYIERHVPFIGARKDDICVHVTGNSMSPTHCPGSLLLVREVPNWKDYFGYGHCFVIFLNDGRRILKEVQKFVENPKDYVLCVSHNKEYPAEELPKSMITAVYKVIMMLTNEGF